jgi:hypothetical protein
MNPCQFISQMKRRRTERRRSIKAQAKTATMSDEEKAGSQGYGVVSDCSINAGGSTPEAVWVVGTKKGAFGPLPYS